MPLAPAASSRICMDECRALCCRGPLLLRLTPAEAPAFKAHAARLGVEAQVTLAADLTAEVRFLEHPGARCPMLDPRTSACRIYENRPARCRAFPDAPRPDCAISNL